MPASSLTTATTSGSSAAGPAFELFTVSRSRREIRGSGGLMLVPDYSVDDAPVPDIVVIPHFDTREFTVIQEWIATVHAGNDLTMSICTGAFQLARTGLLDG